MLLTARIIRTEIRYKRLNDRDTTSQSGRFMVAIPDTQ
jgi:hypothetical protein